MPDEATAAQLAARVETFQAGERQRADAATVDSDVPHLPGVRGSGLALLLQPAAQRLDVVDPRRRPVRVGLHLRAAVRADIPHASAAYSSGGGSTTSPPR